MAVTFYTAPLIIKYHIFSLSSKKRKLQANEAKYKITITAKKKKKKNNFKRKKRTDAMRQDKEEKQLTASVSASPLTTYGVDRTCFITNHAISAKSHLIEWIGSF